MDTNTKYEVKYKNYKVIQKLNNSIEVLLNSNYVGDGNNIDALRNIAREIGVDVTDSDTTQSLGKKVISRILSKEEDTSEKEQFELKITADNVVSTDSRFTIDNLLLGDSYNQVDSYLIKSNGEVVRRKYIKGERKNTNQTMPRIACQVFETSIANLSLEEKENFPICQYTPSGEVIKGIYSSVEEFKKHRNSIEYLVYKSDTGNQFVLYCWNVFSTILFIKECLRRFGAPGDEFVLTYCEKAPKPEIKISIDDELIMQNVNYKNPYSKKLIESRNVIFRGAPGTGKSYLAKKIAADIISNGVLEEYTQLDDEQKKQIEFVQFHPSYDYTDFVEGLRPRTNADGTMGFELQDGVFKKFVATARKNYEDSQNYSYDLVIYNAIKSKKTNTSKSLTVKQEKMKPYIFIIDEINRGEISKIFGELFFSIDPGYRGKSGEVSTQYANLHENPNEKFFIPENVYIIGTMNDIDRSVDSFDFAMRRRFRFIQIKANEHLDMLDSLDDQKYEAIRRMKALNEEISKVEELNENYHIGAAYFLKLKTLTFDKLWTDYLSPLLQDYICGMYDEDGIIKKFAKAYGYEEPQIGDVDDRTED